MAGRSRRSEVARETVAILEAGRYVGPSGREVAIAGALDAARAGTVLHAPGDFPAAFAARDRALANRAGSPPCAFEVVNATTLAAARREVEAGQATRVLALNFASAKNPGGGFLGGSQAQEESLARASGLYACINPIRAYYDANRECRSCLYTDHMIYSPDVPVFRDDDDALLDVPYPVSFLTAPAVNAGAVRANEPGNVPRIGPVMLARIEKVLTLALLHGHEVLILGAWGCGVFRNDPADVARSFAHHFEEEGTFASAFRRVVFAVLDRTPGETTLGPFRKWFGSW